VNAGIFGRFHATLTTSGACASMGIHPSAVYLWPAGYRVRFHPTELLSPTGKLVAHQNEWVNAGGGLYSDRDAESLSLSPSLVIPRQCGIAETVVLIESPVLAGEGPS
jgi:hypothetical protein